MAVENSAMFRTDLAISVRHAHCAFADMAFEMMQRAGSLCVGGGDYAMLNSAVEYPHIV